MFTLIVVGFSLLTTSPETPHRTEITIKDFATHQECVTAGKGLIEALRDTLGQRIRLESYKCSNLSTKGY